MNFNKLAFVLWLLICPILFACTSCDQPALADSSNFQNPGLKDGKTTGSTTKGAPNANPVTLEITYEQGTKTKWKNIYVIWIENETLPFLQNLKICSKLVSGGLRGTALPYWKVNKYPASEKSEVDAVTSATVANSDFTVSAILKNPRVRKFTVYVEVDRYYEPNDWFPIDQPALLYSADVDLDSGIKEYTLSLAGWTPNELATKITPQPPVGKLQKELRYITHQKSGVSFGNPDPRSSTGMVKKITLKIK